MRGIFVLTGFLYCLFPSTG